MQIKLFTIPVSESGKTLQEMNAFLRGNKILEVQNQLVSNEQGAYWCFCVKYMESPLFSTANASKEKVDYKTVLDENAFQKFSILREVRKKIALEEGIPAFAIFTDEELAGLAKLPEITSKSMGTIKGIGEKKIEKYAKFFVDKKVES